MPTAPTDQSDPRPQLDYQPRKKPNGEFDPDHYRMTIGEHLEELRSRLIKGLIGFAVALILCFCFYKSIFSFFTAPLTNALYQKGINPQLVVDEVGEGFMVMIKIAMIVAAAIASPWALYQAWQFVAAGLYPKERKYVTRYLPLSLFLLISGMVFVYLLVLPWTLQFFIDFNLDLPLSLDTSSHVAAAAPGAGTGAGAGLMTVPAFNGDPPQPQELQIWFDASRQQLKFFYDKAVRVISFNSPNLVAQEYKLSNYMDMVVLMLITFGLSFQLPLVVLALERIGIIPIETLQKSRRVVYFVMVIVAAVITPGDVVTATVALMFPLIGLYELGILLARWGKPPEESDTAAA